MALVNINGRDVIVPDDMAQHFDPSATIAGSVFLPQPAIPPSPAPAARPPRTFHGIPFPESYDDEESKSSAPAVFDRDRGVYTNDKGDAVYPYGGKPAPVPRTDAARIGIQGFGDGQEYAGPHSQAPLQADAISGADPNPLGLVAPQSVTGGALPVPGMEQTLAAPGMGRSRDYVAGTVDTAPGIVDGSNKAYAAEQKRSDAHEAALAAFAQTPAGQVQQANTLRMDAYGNSIAAGQALADAQAQSDRDQFEATKAASDYAEGLQRRRQEAWEAKQKLIATKQRQAEQLVYDADHFKVEDPGIWGGKGTVGALYDVLDTWREKALHVSGRAFDCGHTLQEERPEETVAELTAFFA